MAIQPKIKYEPKTCECCGQTTTYLLAIDQQTINIVRAVANAIRAKGINAIHPRKEMMVDTKDLREMENIVRAGKITYTMWNNMTRARAHGLLAKVRGVKANYLLTKKGAKFLRGERVPRYAIISKAEGHQIGYFEPEDHTITIFDVVPYHEPINFEVTDGEVIKTIEEYREKINQQKLI